MMGNDSRDKRRHRILEQKSGTFNRVMTKIQKTEWDRGNIKRDDG